MANQWLLVRGTPVVRDHDDKQVAFDVARKLDGLQADLSGDVFAEYLEDSTLKTLVSGGGLELRVVADVLSVETRYECGRVLTDAEVTALVQYTLEQWADGVGSADIWAHGSGKNIVSTWDGQELFELRTSWLPKPVRVEWKLDMQTHARTLRLVSG